MIIKFFYLTACIALLSTNILFGAFEFSIYAPISYLITFTDFRTGISSGGTTISHDLGATGGDMFSTGALSQIGYNFIINDSTNAGVKGFSLAAEVGYYYQNYNVLFKYVDAKLLTSFHTLNLGAIFKVNISSLWSSSIRSSFGFGGGIKLPFSGKVSLESSIIDIEEDLSFSDIKDAFEAPVIPYIKFAMDTYYHINKDIAFIFGSYFSYNFPLKYDISDANSFVNGLNIGIKKYEISSLEVGFIFGFYFSPVKNN